MKSFIAALVLIIASVSQANVCTLVWDQQDQKHVEYYRTQLTNEVKKVLIRAYKNVNIDVKAADIDFGTTIQSRELVTGSQYPFYITKIGYNIAHVKTGTTTTDFNVRGYEPGMKPTSEAWLVRTGLGIEGRYNAIGDIQSYLCSSFSATFAEMAQQERQIYNFSVSRVTNNYVVGITQQIEAAQSVVEIKE